MAHGNILNSWCKSGVRSQCCRADVRGLPPGVAMDVGVVCARIWRLRWRQKVKGVSGISARCGLLASRIFPRTVQTGVVACYRICRPLLKWQLLEKCKDCQRWIAACRRSMRDNAAAESEGLLASITRCAVLSGDGRQFAARGYLFMARQMNPPCRFWLELA